MRKLIEVTGIGFPNKGAELMLYAVVDQLRARFGDDVQICCQPWQSFKESYRLLGRKNILQLGSVTLKGYPLNFLFNLLPVKLADTFGIARPRDVDIVLDASGLRYSDSWGAKTAEEKACKYEKLKRKGRKVIILPQAFGPFENPKVAAAVKRVVEASELCFARDDVSYKYLTGICGGSQKIHKAPDFTNLVNPVVGFDGADFSGKVIIIPNQRMLDKTDITVARNYYEHLLNLCRHLRELGEELVIINHEGNADDKICKRLSADCGSLPIVTHWNPVYIKTMIGFGKLVVSSRFHGCVSALSQGVPVIATSWNHKYEMLLSDYGIGGNLVDLTSTTVDAEMVGTALLPSTKEKVKSAVSQYKKKSVSMWDSVCALMM